MTQMIIKGLFRRENHEHSEEKSWKKGEEMVTDRRKGRRQSITELEERRMKRRKRGKWKEKQ